MMAQGYQPTKQRHTFLQENHEKCFPVGASVQKVNSYTKGQKETLC